MNPDLEGNSSKKTFPKIRLFTATDCLKSGVVFEIDGVDFEYLTKVMRQKIGNNLLLFNGKNGEFLAEIIEIRKKSLLALVKSQVAIQQQAANIGLAFALIKNIRIDYLAAKATELGIAYFQPLITKHCVVNNFNSQRFFANIKEACEQCERNDLPEIQSLLDFKSLIELQNQDSSDRKGHKKIILYGDESGAGKTASFLLNKIADEFGKASKELKVEILIGPEGGFSRDEFEILRTTKNCFALNLGPRILRADTAAFAAITLVQEFLGDFNQQ